MSDENLRLKVDYVPSKIVVGKFDTTIDANTAFIDTERESMTAGFVTCRYKNTKWISASVFERLCKFKPCVQRNAEKELNKILKNAVNDFDNVPTSGFSLVDVNCNLYCYSTRDYSYCGDVVLKDPRGFCVAITQENFAQMLCDCKGNMKNGVLDDSVKFVYAFGDRACLIAADSERCKYILAMQDQAKDEQGNISYIKPSKFEVGHAYLASDSFSFDSAAKGIYVYLGQFKTYSEGYIKNSIDAGKNVDFEQQLEREKSSRYSYSWSQNFRSRPDAKVFYLVKPLAKIDVEQKRKYSYINFSPKDLSKKFTREVKLDPSWKMSNGKPFSVDNALEEMSTMPMYSKISDETYKNFHHPSPEAIKAMPMETFAAALAAKDYDTCEDKNVKYPLACLPFYFGGYCRDMSVVPSLVYNGMIEISNESYYWNANSSTAQFKLKDISGKTTQELCELLLSKTLCTRKIETDSYRDQRIPFSNHITSLHPKVLDAYMLLKPYTFENPKFENGKAVPDNFFLHINKEWAKLSAVSHSSIYVSAHHLKKWKETCEDYVKATPEYANW